MKNLMRRDKIEYRSYIPSIELPTFSFPGRGGGRTTSRPGLTRSPHIDSMNGGLFKGAPPGQSRKFSDLVDGQDPPRVDVNARTKATYPDVDGRKVKEPSKTKNQIDEMDIDDAQALKSGGLNLGSYCKKNPGTCLGIAGVFAYIAYTGLDTLNDMEEEEKACLDACYPNDWEEAKAAKTRPNYKEEKDAAGNDTDYAPLYADDLDISNALCTPQNVNAMGMLDDWVIDPDHCDVFCGAACDLKFMDEFGNDIWEDIKDLFMDIPGIGPFVDGMKKYLPYILGFIVLLILFKLITMMGLFKRSQPTY
jgi:hypothetical protein